MSEGEGEGGRGDPTAKPVWDFSKNFCCVVCGLATHRHVNNQPIHRICEEKGGGTP